MGLLEDKNNMVIFARENLNVCVAFKIHDQTIHFKYFTREYLAIVVRFAGIRAIHSLYFCINFHILQYPL